MMKSQTRLTLCAGLGAGALLFGTAGARVCYYDHTTWRCSFIASPGPGDRWCGENQDVYCPDEIVSDPYITIALPATADGKNKDSTWSPTCTVTFKPAHCSGGLCVTSFGTTSGTGHESKVDPASACAQSDPD